MNKLNNQSLTPYAQSLRREMTKEEKHLWYDFLKKLPFPVKRQKPIGRYIADFYIPCAKIVIELDGTQHGSEEHHAADVVRDRFMEQRGILVLRYTNDQIHKHFDDVCEHIWACIFDE